MRQQAVWAWAGAMLLAAGCGPERADLARHLAVAEALRPSLVRVQYHLRYDKGEAPEAGQTCLEEERPVEQAGFLLGSTEVVTEDWRVHPRFLERITVRLGDDVVPGRLAAWATMQSAALVRLDRPLEGGRPLAFHAHAAPPYLSAKYLESEGQWRIHVGPFGGGVSVPEKGRPYQGAFIGELILGADGTPVGLSMGEMPADESWKGPPLAWTFLGADQRHALFRRLEERAARTILRATIHLRSPKREAGGRFQVRDDTDAATTVHATALVLAADRVLVLAALRPKTTARLERIVIHLPDGKAVAAAFVGSLADYGALVVAPDEPLRESLALSAAPIEDLRYALLGQVEVRLHGEDRTVYVDHGRIEMLEIGWRGEVELETLLGGQQVFLFDPDGALAALPLGRRERVATERRWSSDRSQLVPAARLRPILADLAAHADPGNVPLPEETEKRLAWLGIIPQPLDRDLARALGVAHLTGDGEKGAIVSYVYPGSPAAEAGIEPGVILLRLRVEGQAEPIEVSLEDQDRYDRGPFPWDRLEEVPDAYLERIPPPWPPAEDALTRALTDLGFGRRFEADFFIGGRVAAKPFTVTAMPPHYESAPRFRAEGLGLTVRDLTYEVRRYFQRAEGEPGVVVSKIEPGSKAAVAGIKPYEIVTHVNGRPVADVRAFEEAVRAGGDLRLNVKRMMQGRVVKLTLAPGPAPLDAPDADAEPPPGAGEP